MHEILTFQYTIQYTYVQIYYFNCVRSRNFVNLLNLLKSESFTFQRQINDWPATDLAKKGLHLQNIKFATLNMNLRIVIIWHVYVAMK